MRKNRIQNIILHTSQNTDFSLISQKVSELHADIIERKLLELNLTKEEKNLVIDKIIAKLKGEARAIK